MASPDISPLVAIMARLRDRETGCPWDIEQDFASIAPYTIEEAYEVADAIERNDMAALKDELGDLLLQVVFHSRMAEEAGLFSLSDVITAICEKMVRRHPHVFGPNGHGDAEASPGWEQIKAAERAEKSGDDNSALAGVASGLPALARAEKLQKRAARVGFDWNDVSAVQDKLMEELEELSSATTPDHVAEEIGDLLFAAANLARHHHVDPEAALRAANLKFERRFRAMEAMTGPVPFPDLSLAQQEALWQAVKAAE
ncbi:MAG: nucleoside triphosphate pyrophosphohydrolase [Sphingobium sp.]|nr:nucleoside triphosphate pyrophosphohydrolase [Sphingobium sp.]